MTYAAHGKIITLTRLYVAGITVILLQMAPRLEPLPMLFSVYELQQRHIPSDRLGFQTMVHKTMRQNNCSRMRVR